MRTRTAWLAGLLLAATLAGCSSGSDDPKPDVAVKEPAASEAAQPEPEEPAAEAGPLAFGAAQETVGDGGVGALAMTPTTVVHFTEEPYNKPDNGMFVLVVVKQMAVNAVAAEEVPPITGDGWGWIAPDGQAIDSGGGQAFNVTAKGFHSAGPVQPGTFVWDSVVFDLTPEQARGGTLEYVDGNQVPYRWKVPAQDTGPEVAKVRKRLGL